MYDILGQPVRKPTPTDIPILIASDIRHRKLLGLYAVDPFARFFHLYEYAY
ncbi:MAG: hypothetical protein R2882_13465 [Gemmatimonadales bacterium]